MILLDEFLTRASQSGSQLPTLFIFEQEVSLRGQSHETPDEGIQDELDIWVLVLHIVLRNCLERSGGEDSSFFFF